MIIGFHKSFDKQFILSAQAQKDRVKKTILSFQANPLGPSFRNHPLKGEWRKYRSISAGGYLRLHYRVMSEEEVLFVTVGTHSQLYK